MTSLRSRLLLYVLPLVMVPLVLSIATSVAIMRRMARADYGERMNAAFRGVELELGEMKTDLLASARALAGVPRLIEALAHGDRQTLLNILANSAGMLGVDDAHAVSPSGFVVAGAMRATRYGMPDPDVRSLLAEPSPSTVKIARHKLGFGVVVVHLVKKDDQTVGAVKLVRLLDYRFLTSIKRKYGLEAAVYDGDRLQAVTFREPAVVTDVDLDAVRRGTPDAAEQINLAGMPYFAVGRPIGLENQETTGTLVLASSAEELSDTLVLLSTLAGLIAVALIPLALMLAYRVTSSIVRPIASLTRMTQMVAKGDLKARVPVGLPDEIGQLTAAFNRMTKDLQSTTTSMETLNREIADRKQVEQQRKQLIAQLESQNAELERFTYTVSHDLKSPLITIKGFVGVIQQDLSDGNQEATRADLLRIAAAADKMYGLLSELLELSRIGRKINPPQSVPMEELVREATEMVWGQIEEHGVRVESAANLPVVFGDRPRLLEVMQNLLANAVKYMGDQPQPRIEVGARRDGDETVCYVRDNGIGIDPHYHEKVFGLFEQLDHQADGSGIGLALVKRIVEVHGGRIWVESEGEGHGSSFCFTLPTQGG